MVKKGLITTNYIFCGKPWPFDPNLFYDSKHVGQKTRQNNSKEKNRAL